MQSNQFNFDLEGHQSANKKDEFTEELESNLDNISDQYMDFIKQQVSLI